MIKPPDFIELDLKKDEEELVKALELKLNKPLYPAQVERIMLNVFAQYLYLAKAKFNEGARLNLARFSKAPFLDFIGEALGCRRLKAERGKSSLKIELCETFSSDLTIAKGLEGLTKDEKHGFSTSSDLVIKAGESFGIVEIEALEACKAVNDYGVGDIKILVKPFSYIKSVSNINAVSGGADEETDGAYFERICLAPESFTCAGSRLAYVYQTLSAHSAIIDVAVESPQIPASLTITGETEVSEIEKSGIITGKDYTCSVDYKSGEMILNADFNGVEREFKISLPPAATVNVYPLTAEDELPVSVKEAVEKKLSGEDVTPMTDYVKVYSCVKINEEINLTVILDIDADEDSTKKLVELEISNYKKEIRKKLNAEILPSHIVGRARNVQGVYDCELNGFTKKTAKIGEFFDLTINTKYERQA